MDPSNPLTLAMRITHHVPVQAKRSAAVQGTWPDLECHSPDNRFSPRAPISEDCALIPNAPGSAKVRSQAIP